MLFQGQWSFVRTVPLVGLFLRCRCAKTELITLDLIFPLTYQLFWNSGGYSRPNLSFNKSASPERLFSSARVSFLEASLSQIYPSVVPGETIPHHVPQSSIFQASLSVLDLNGADGNVMGIHDFLCLPEWTGAEVQEESYLDVRPTLQRLPFYCTPPAAAEAVIPDPTSEDLAASTSGAASSHVAKRTRSALAQSSGSTTRPSLFVGDDDESNDDDDACVEISLVTPLLSAADVSGDAIHMDFFPFSAGPYYATYPEGGVAGNREFTRKEWDAPYRPTFGVLTKEVFKDPDVCKTVVHQFPTPADSSLKGYEEKVANMTGLELQVAALKKQVFGLNDKLTSSDASFAKSKAKGKERKKKIKSLGKSLDNLHAEVALFSAALNQATILEAERDEDILRLKTTPSDFLSFFRGQFQGLVQKFLASNEFSRVQGGLLSLAASARFKRGLSMHRTKDEFVVVLMKMVNFMPGLKPEKLLSTNVNFTASTIASEHNEKMVNAEVDGWTKDDDVHRCWWGVFLSVLFLCGCFFCHEKVMVGFSSAAGEEGCLDLEFMATALGEWPSLLGL
ncbi:hypothetical protein Tco_0810319 [Tanacetum coccineum]